MFADDRGHFRIASGPEGARLVVFCPGYRRRYEVLRAPVEGRDLDLGDLALAPKDDE